MQDISFGKAITIIGLILVLCGYAECQAANYKLIDRIDGVATLSSIGINSHAKESMFAFFAKKVGSSVVKIGEQFVKNKLSDKQSKKVDVATIPESNVIIVEDK